MVVALHSSSGIPRIAGRLAGQDGGGGGGGVVEAEELRVALDHQRHGAALEGVGGEGVEALAPLGVLGAEVALEVLVHDEVEQAEQAGGVGANSVAMLTGCAAPSIPADLNGDGLVDTADLGVLISQFGTMCP